MSISLSTDFNRPDPVIRRSPVTVKSVPIAVCQLYKLVSLERSLNTTKKGLFNESDKQRQPQVTRTSTSIPANASAAPT